MDSRRFAIAAAFYFVCAPMAYVCAAGDPVPASVPAGSSLEKPAQSRSTEPLYYIILKEPKDLDEFWQRVDHPDLVVRRATGQSGDRAADALTPVPDSRPWVINSVGVHGNVGLEFADLDIDINVSILPATDSVVWVPIRLDRQKLSSVEESGKDVMVRITRNQQCEVGLSGARAHNLRAACVPRSIRHPRGRACR